jgi:N-acetylmuramoyl-L-alanine amidase
MSERAMLRLHSAALIALLLIAVCPATALAALAVAGPATAPASAAAATADDPDATLGVVYADGRQTEDVPLYRLEKGSEELYISTFDIARIFKATKYWTPESRKLVLRIDSRRYLFTIDTRVVVIDEEPMLLRVPVRYADGSVMVPLEFITEILSPRSWEKIELDEDRHVLTIGSPDYNITDIRFVEDEEGTRAEIDLTEELLYHVNSDTPGILRIKIYSGRLNPLKMTVPEGKGLFNRVRAEQTEHDAYLFFDVKRTAARFKVEFERAGDALERERRLIIFLEKGELPEIPDVDYAGKRMLEILDEETLSKGKTPLRIVAIDPGHGGVDNGKVGVTGVLEKDVNLEVALMLRDRLAGDLGLEVVLTRDRDELIPFDRRVEIANTAGADIFISIHCNGWYSPSAGGVETLFLAPARTEDEKRLAREENASIRFENPDLDPAEVDDLDFILWDVVQNKFINESSGLAEIVQKELADALDIRNRGVKQGGLRVLKGLVMPAVLVELAFLSNPREEELLLRESFREQVVRGIVEAMRRYQETHTARSR